jgi:hypothetical protein
MAHAMPTFRLIGFTLANVGLRLWSHWLKTSTTHARKGPLNFLPRRRHATTKPRPNRAVMKELTARIPGYLQLTLDSGLTKVIVEAGLQRDSTLAKPFDAGRDKRDRSTGIKNLKKNIRPSLCAGYGCAYQGIGISVTRLA